ncbi:MAG: endonuclease domain-containing protein [Chitinophagales bacterium]|jgi:very-short-patch-repair endonuclease|nr:endonuclease domain-containing protein [Saprospirales bacterium]MBP6659268.1 endonuclease domain-containing protein [Chitinophagales bacterium]
MNSKLFFDANKIVIDYSKSLRKKQTDAEKLLWSNLRNRKLNGYKFRRQHAIKSYIVDFYCAEKMLSIEVDGEIHLKKEQIEYDKNRTEELNLLEIKEIRFTNEEIDKNISLVLKKILIELEKK